MQVVAPLARESIGSLDGTLDSSCGFFCNLDGNIKLSEKCHTNLSGHTGMEGFPMEACEVGS